MFSWWENCTKWPLNYFVEYIFLQMFYYPSCCCLCCCCCSCYCLFVFCVFVVVVLLLFQVQMAKIFKTSNRLVGHVTCVMNLRLYENTDTDLIRGHGRCKVNYALNDFLLSYSKKPPKIYNFAHAYCRMPELYILFSSGIKTGKTTVSLRKHAYSNILKILPPKKK